ncbi:cytidylyltransferase domain-containing protein [Candidatus Methylopumilus planktonicus]|uniref:acylneuraminate cytidylyltransferase family protein n=1 Tax=Candidatus Methylopumilus planktonicus TaxID=1581557 RepID=UPI003BEEB64E
MNNVSLIPLRGGSKSIPKKNINFLAGKALCAWTLEAAAGCKAINAVYVSTDSEEIADVVQGLDLGLQVIMRPAKYATDEASTEEVMLHFMNQVDFDVLLTIQATSPLLMSRDLDLAIAQFQGQQLDSMLSAVRTKRFFWQDDATPINYDPLHRPRRQDFCGTLMENGAFYLTRRDILQRYQCRLGGKIGIYEMDELTAVEIDEPEDWDRVERLLLERKV